MREKHVLAGKTVILNHRPPDPDRLNGEEFIVEDWWENISGKSWTKSWTDGIDNFACLKYAIRSTFAGLPMDDEVVYGKVGSFGLGYLIHVSELGKVVKP